MGFVLKQQDHCLSCFFMQTDIQAVTVIEEPMDDAGQTENFSNREKKTVFTKVQREPTEAALLDSIHVSAHYLKSRGGAFPGKAFQMQ